MSNPVFPLTHLDFSDAFIHVTPPNPFRVNFFPRTSDFENLLFLSQLPFFAPSPSADNFPTLLELPSSSTLSFTAPGYHWSIRPFVDLASEDEDAQSEDSKEDLPSGHDDLPPLEDVVETELRTAFSRLLLRQTGLIHLEPPFNATLQDHPPRYASQSQAVPTPTYFGRSSDSLALREAIDRAIVEYKEAVHRIGDVLSIHIALLRSVEQDHSQ